MVEWKGPISRAHRHDHLFVVGVLGLMAPVLIYIGIKTDTFRYMLPGLVVIMIVMMVFFGLWGGSQYDYMASMWDIDKDFIAMRLETNLQKVGETVERTTRGKMEIIRTSSMMILLTPGPAWTNIYVGPLHSTTDEQVRNMILLVDGTLEGVDLFFGGEED